MQEAERLIATEWIKDLDPAGIDLYASIPRLVAWHCTAPDDRYIRELVAHLQAAPEFLEMFRDGRLVGVVFHCLDRVALDLPRGIFGVKLGPASFRTFGESEYRLMGSFIKIITPLVFPYAGAILNLDADMSFGRGRGGWEAVYRLTNQRQGVDALFDLAVQFGFVVTDHPDSTWTGEPMEEGQKRYYMARPGMHRFVPLYCCGAIARGVAHEGQRRLTAAWVQEFLMVLIRPDCTPEQPALSAAVWRSGFAPLAAPMTFCSLYAERIRFGLECLYVHQGRD